MAWINVPVTGPDAWTAGYFLNVTAPLAALGGSGPVLTHCTVGFRSAAYTIAFLSAQAGECTAHALAEARKIGFSYGEHEEDAKVVQLFNDVLGC